jgi:hypothetical protein
MHLERRNSSERMPHDKKRNDPWLQTRIWSWALKGTQWHDRLTVSCKITVWLTHCQSLHSEDGGSMDLWNVSILPQHYMEDDDMNLCHEDLISCMELVGHIARIFQNCPHIDTISYACLIRHLKNIFLIQSIVMCSIIRIALSKLISCFCPNCDRWK